MTRHSSRRGRPFYGDSMLALVLVCAVALGAAVHQSAAGVGASGS